ncbi:MAG: DUF5793 family protein [Halobacteriales archaeon]
MRREYFSLDVTNVDWVDTDTDPAKPTLTITFEGAEATLRDQLKDADGEILEASETDVNFRLQGSLEDEEPAGVVAVTNRITGDFVCELNVDAEDIFAFITAARRYGEQTDDDVRYQAIIQIDGDSIVTYNKQTLLVYSEDGELLRQHSLIPGNVEI